MAESTSQSDDLRAEYQALAKRNWTAIQDIHRAYDRFSRRAKRLLVLLFVVQIATAVGLYVSLSSTSSLTGRVAAGQHATTSALCALRDDLQQRQAAGRDFLAKHPRGIPGIPAPTIRASLNGERRTVQALSPIRCPPPKRPPPKH